MSSEEKIQFLAGRMHEGLTEVKKALTKLDDQVGSLREEGSATATQVAALETALADLRDRIDGLDEKREALRIDLQALASRINIATDGVAACAAEKKEEARLANYKKLAGDIIKMLAAAGAALGADRLAGG